MPVDYEALAKQSGAISSQPAAVDYEALAKQAGATSSQPGAPAPKPAEPEGSAISRFFDPINPMHLVHALLKPSTDPNEDPRTTFGKNVIGLGKNVVDASAAHARAAIDFAKKGDPVSAIGHAMYAIPLVGAAGYDAAERFRSGDMAGGTSAFLSLVAPELVPKVIPKTVNVSALPKPNPVLAEAVKFGQREGIPISAATASGNKAVKGVQAVVDHSPIGSFVSQTARDAEAAGFKRVGEKLADQVHPEPIDPTQAGEAVTGAIEGRIGELAGKANQAYGRLRELEADPKNTRSVQTGFQWEETGKMKPSGIPESRLVPTMEDVPMPVDLRDVKKQLRPVFQQMMRQLPVSQQRASAGLKAIENILDGPDHAPLSQVDTDLGTIKGIARGADLPELKNMSQGLAAHAVQKLEDAVQAAVKLAGPEAEEALGAGREATAAKYDVADVLKSLPKKGEEGRQVFQQTIWNHDSGIEKLKKIQEIAPAELPKLGRAYLQEMFETSAAEGGFDKTGTMLHKWQNLGPETKKLLFKNPMMVSDLDNFFLLAKKAAENPNPSGSALVGSLVAGLGYAVTNPATGVPMLIGSGALSKLLHSPAGVAALSDGLSVPVGKGAASAAAANRILKVAGEAAQPASE